MKISAQLLAVPVLLLGLTACAGPGDAPASAPTAPSVEPAVAETTQAQPAPVQPTQGLSERGNYMKRPGQPVSLSIDGQEDSPVLKFSVDKIEVDPQCSGGYLREPENGHFVSLDISVETGPPQQFAEAFNGKDFLFNPHAWKFITPSGTTANSVASTASYSCLAEGDRIPEMGPAERATGKIVLDVPAKTGTLIYAPGFIDEAWEWKL